MDFSALRAYQDGLIGRLSVGTGLSVYSKDQEVYRHMNGFADREKGLPVRGDTLFHMYSLTKPLVCALALKLYEQGRFQLEDPVSQYLPEYAHLKVEFDQGVRDAKCRMLLWHLFTMTSGLDYNVEAMTPFFMSQGPLLTTRQAAAFLAKKPLSFEPGERFLYGFSHDVLGAVLEVITGQSLGQLLKEHLFSPLGMNNSFFQVPADSRKLLAKAYQLEPPFDLLDDAHPLDHFLQFESGGGGLIMSLDDYLMFARMLARGGTSQDGKTILKPQTLQLMHTNQLSGDLLAGYQENRPGYGYGMGVRVMLDPQSIGAESKVSEYGWSGMMGCYFLVQPQDQVCAVFVTQSMPGPNRPVHPQLRDLICRAVRM